MLPKYMAKSLFLRSVLYARLAYFDLFGAYLNQHGRSDKAVYIPKAIQGTGLMKKLEKGLDKRSSCGTLTLIRSIVQNMLMNLASIFTSIFNLAHGNRVEPSIQTAQQPKKPRQISIMSGSKISAVIHTPQPLDGPNNHGPLINVLTWFLAIVSFLTVSTRIATKLLVSKKVNTDDAMISTSLVSVLDEALPP
jgi:hypothetical protein